MGLMGTALMGKAFLGRPTMVSEPLEALTNAEPVHSGGSCGEITSLVTMVTVAAAAASYDDEVHSRAALREAFGDSSDSDSDAPRGASAASTPPVHGADRERWRWAAVAGVRGLWLCAAFLSPEEQSRLLAAIQRGE